MLINRKLEVDFLHSEYFNLEESKKKAAKILLWMPVILIKLLNSCHEREHWNAKRLQLAELSRSQKPKIIHEFLQLK